MPEEASILSEVTVSRLAEYTPAVAADIGKLLAEVWGLDGKPVSKQSLEFIIESPDREQIIAAHLGKVVGVATVTLHVTPSGTEGWLNDFATAPAVRGQGIGRLLFGEVMRWCDEHDTTLGFTASSPAAQRFYRSVGAWSDYRTTHFRAVPS